MNLIEQIESIRRSAAEQPIKGYYVPRAFKGSRSCRDSVMRQVAKVYEILKEAGERGILRDEVRRRIGVDKNRFSAICKVLIKDGSYFIRLANDAWGSEYSCKNRVMYHPDYKT